MAKMTRNNLKSLVKECLFEILLEASGDGAEKLLEAKKVTNKKTARRGRPALDNIRMGGQKPAKGSQKQARQRKPEASSTQAGGG